MSKWATADGQKITVSKSDQTQQNVTELGQVKDHRGFGLDFANSLASERSRNITFIALVP